MFGIVYMLSNIFFLYLANLLKSHEQHFQFVF